MAKLNLSRFIPSFKRDAPAPPQKVFIQPEGDSWEVSETEPIHIQKTRIDDLINGEYSSQNFMELFYCLPEIFAPIHEIASRVADATWQLKRSSTDEIIFNDPDFNRLFSQPNALKDMRSFVYQSVCYEIITGKQLWFFNRSNALPDEYKSIIAWWNLPAHKVTAVVKDNFDIYTATEIKDFITKFKMPYKNGTKEFDTNKVLPIFHLDLREGNNVNKVCSMLLGASKAIKNLIPVYEARGVIYIKRGALGFLVSRKKDASGSVALTKKEKDRVNAEVNSRFGLTGGKHTVGLVGEDIDYVKTSMTIAEMLPFEETLADAVSIYACLRVPRHLVPSKDNSTFANADADLKTFIENTIIPWAQRYALLWTNYMNIKSKYIWPDYSHLSILQNNKKDEATADKINSSTWLERWTNSACSLNEWINDIGGEPGTGNLFEKKLLELTPKELAVAQSIIKKMNPNGNQDNPGDSAEAGKKNKGVKS